MGLFVDSIFLNPVDFADAPLPLLDGCIFDKYAATINFHFSKYTQPKRLQLSGTTITNINALDNESFLALQLDSNALLAGETFKISGSALNTGTLTIVSATATTITVSAALTAETIEVGTIYVTSAVTALDFYYNLIGNQENLNFYSKTDINVLQKYNVTGIAAGTTTPKALNIATKSLAWVTDAITGVASTSTIAGAGISGTGAAYKQAFTIVHYFSQAPYFLSQFMGNFSSLLPPSIYTPSVSASGLISGAGLQYVANIGAKYFATDIAPQNFITINNQNGIACWLDQNPAGTQPDFTVSSITYADSVTGATLTSIDFTKTTNVTIVLKSASAGFVNNSSVIVLNHFYAPLNPAQYQNKSTTLWQNFINDRVVLTVGSAAPAGINGSFYGGIYQVITNAIATYNSTSQVTVTFQAVFSTSTSSVTNTFIANPGNRNYGLVCTTEDISGGGGGVPMSRVAVLCDFNSYSYDQTNPNLLKLWDYIHCYPYPSVNGGESNNIAGREGEKFMCQLPFQLSTAVSNGVTPVLESIVASVVAIKTGKADFVVESQTINVGSACTSGGVQTPNISISRGFQTFSGDPFNLITLKQASQYNGAGGSNLVGFLLSYPLILRYDYWNSINPSLPGQGNCSAPIQNDVQNVNNSWSNLINGGWTLVLRFTLNVQGYDGYVTPYQVQTTLTCNNLGDPATSGPTYVQTTTYYGANANDTTTYNQIVAGILPNSQTRVSMKFTPDGSTNPYNAYRATLGIDLVGMGGVLSEQLASTELPAPTGSPWSAPAQNGSPTTFYSNGLSMNIYADGSVIVEGIYDDTVFGWAQQNKQLVIVGNLGLYNSGLETAGGSTIETAGGTQILP